MPSEVLTKEGLEMQTKVKWLRMARPAFGFLKLRLAGQLLVGDG